MSQNIPPYLYNLVFYDVSDSRMTKQLSIYVAKIWLALFFDDR